MPDIKQPPPPDLRARAAGAAETAAAAGVINEETLARIVNGKVSRAILEQVRKAVTRALVMAEAAGPADSDNAAAKRSRRRQEELAAAQILYRAVVQLFTGSDDMEAELERAADELVQE